MTKRSIVTMALLLAALSACRRSAAPPPYSAQDALKTFKINSGFHLELFAAEPLISSPVAMDIDENGRIYVVEMPGYPLDTRPTGRIVRLEDTNGDGLPDRRTVFADGLVLPDGVMSWKQGVLVTAAPNVWYFGDTQGSGKADLRQKVLTGFAFTNPQHMVNGPLYGLDNWIYLAHSGHATAVVFKKLFGDVGSDIHYADRPAPALKMGEFNVRLRPDSYQLEALSGWSQYGQAFDEWGHHFMISNSDAGFHEVVAARYLKRNPDLLIDSASQNVTTPENSKVYAVTEHPRFEILTDVGTLTSACSITFPYLGGAFPANFNRVSIIAEPAHNMAHCDVWSDAGATYAAKRLDEGKEFLASTDSWSRPVFFYVGPDGALYMIDYYRQVIEHPEWMGADTYKANYLYNGQDRGRIYRIVPDNPTIPRFKNIHLSQASDAELVQQLPSPNIWWRRTAQRLLVERQSAAAVAPLIRLADARPSAVGRLHALWTLEGLGKLPPALILKALDDPEPGVRENAVVLAEPRLRGNAALVEKLLEMAGDSNPKVRFQLLCTLGFVDSPRVRSAQNHVIARDIEDPWIHVAALSAPSDRGPQYLRFALSHLHDRQTEGRAGFFRLASSVVGARLNGGEIQQVLTVVAATRRPDAEWWRAACLQGLADGTQARGARAATVLAGSRDLLLQLFEQSPGPVASHSLDLLAVAGLPSDAAASRALQGAQALAANVQADATARANAVSLLALAGTTTQRQLFESLVDPSQPEAVQLAAVRALRRVGDEATAQSLLGKWRAMAPDVRSEAIPVFLHRSENVRLLLSAVKSGDVQPWQLNAYKPRLFMEKDPELRALARSLLEQNPGEREKVLQRYQAALDMRGDIPRARETFRRVCSKCHQLDGVGTAVGPNLGTVRNHPKSELLTDILIPSKSIERGYETYVVVKKTGESADGILSAQTPASITLRQEQGKQVTISRADVRDMYVSNLSLMPEDLDKQLSVQDVADLLTYLKNAR